MAETSLELVSEEGGTLMLNFRGKRVRSKVRSHLKRRCVLEYRDRDRRRPASGFGKMLHDLQERVR